MPTNDKHSTGDHPPPAGDFVAHPNSGRGRPSDKWHPQTQIFAGAKTNNGRREDLKSNFAMQQQELGMMTQQFPNPRLDIF